MAIENIHHVAIRRRNMEKTKAFYVDKLGFKVVAENKREKENDIKLDLIKKNIFLEIFVDDNAQALGKEKQCGYIHVAIASECIEEDVAWLKTKGIECEPIRRNPFTNQKITFFYDDENIAFELHE